MADELPQPTETHVVGQQQAGAVVDNLIPGKREGSGLRPTTMLEEIANAIVDPIPAREVFGAIGREANRRLEAAQERGDRLQERLMDERVAHARTDERLHRGQTQSGAQVLLQILGSAAIGFGLGGMGTVPSLVSWAWCVGGLVIAVFGCWPIISLRLGQHRGG